MSAPVRYQPIGIPEASASVGWLRFSIATRSVFWSIFGVLIAAVVLDAWDPPAAARWTLVAAALFDVFLDLKVLHRVFVREESFPIMPGMEFRPEAGEHLDLVWEAENLSSLGSKLPGCSYITWVGQDKIGRLRIWIDSEDAKSWHIQQELSTLVRELQKCLVEPKEDSQETPT